MIHKKQKNTNLVLRYEGKENSKDRLYYHNLVNAGMCMSNGLSLLMAGHKRFALKHSSGMYHSGSAGLQGTKEQVDALIDMSKHKI